MEERVAQYPDKAWQKILFVVIPDISLKANAENIFQCALEIPNTNFVDTAKTVYTPSKSDFRLCTRIIITNTNYKWESIARFVLLRPPILKVKVLIFKTIKVTCFAAEKSGIPVHMDPEFRSKTLEQFSWS